MVADYQRNVGCEKKTSHVVSCYSMVTIDTICFGMFSFLLVMFSPLNPRNIGLLKGFD